jgi:hypothetical protein
MLREIIRASFGCRLPAWYPRSFANSQDSRYNALEQLANPTEGSFRMSVTISINDDLAARLKYQARALDLSLRDWAVEILSNGCALDVNSERWKKLNGRRIRLIQRRRKAGLTRAEESELAALQHVTAKATEQWDQQMLRNLQQYEALTSASDG